MSSFLAATPLKEILSALGGAPLYWDNAKRTLSKIVEAVGGTPRYWDTSEALLKKWLAAIGGTPAYSDNVEMTLRKIAGQLGVSVSYQDNRSTLLQKILGGEPTPPAVAAEVDLYVHFTAPAAGTASSPAIMAAAEVGGISGSWSYEAGRPNPLAHTKIQNISTTRFWPLKCAGTTYQEESKVIVMDLSGDDSLWERLQRGLPAGHTNATLTMVLYNGHTGDAGIDICFLEGDSGDYAICQTSNNGGVNEMFSHTGAIPDGSGKHGDVPVGTYILTVNFNKNDGMGRVVVINNATGEVVLASQNELAGNQDLGFWKLGTYLVFSGGQLRVSNMGISFTDTKLLDPFTVPAPSSVVATSTNIDEVTLTWTSVCQYFEIDRSSNGGSSWSISIGAADMEDATDNSCEYVDDTVVDGQTYIYRIRAIVVPAQKISANTSSNSITINNGEFPWGIDTFSGAANFDDIADRAGWDAPAGPQAYLFADGTLRGNQARWRALFAGSISANQRSEVQLIIGADEGFAFMIGAAVRISADYANNYEVVYSELALALQIRKRNAGTNVQVGSNFTGTFATGHWIAIEATGTGAATRLTIQHSTDGVNWTTLTGGSNVDPGGTYIDGGNPGVSGHAPFGLVESIQINSWKAYEL